MKRYFLVTTLVVAMVLSMVGSAFAFTDVASDAEYASDFTMLEEIGVYQGYPDGTAKPGNAITRAEFAALVVRALDKESVAQAVNTYETSFTDDAAIPAWARGYVIVANSLNIVNGYPDGSFKAAGNVTFAEAIAMLARALKVDEAATGAWPTNYLVLGADIDLTDGVDPVANLPITRGEMAIMTANAMVSKWTINEDDELVKDLADDETLLGKIDEDLYDEYGSTDLAGVIEDYLPSSERIEVDGTYFDLATNDDGDVTTMVAFNDGDEYAFDWDADNGDSDTITEDDEVVLTMNSDDEVTDIAVTRNTYDDSFLTDVDTDEDETLFGEITVLDSGEENDTLNVDDDTTILLDGEEVTLADLEDAYDDFDDTYETNPIVTVRTEGDIEDDGEYAIYISVITENTVEGEITAAGNDGDPYVRIEGDKVYYDNDYLQVGDELGVGDTVTLLLNEDDVAMVLLDAVAEEDNYFAKVTEYMLDEDDDLDTLTVILADGTEAEINSFADGAATLSLVEGNLNMVFEVTVNDDGDATLATPSDGVGPYDYQDHSSTWIQVNDSKHVIADNVFVYDEADEDYVELSDLDDDPADSITLYETDGVVGYIVIELAD